MVPFDRPFTNFYSWAIVSIALCCYVPFSSYLTLKVIQTGTIRKLWSDFLFAFYSNDGHIFNRLWDRPIQR